jgi:solute:Na+ symporter, SSS family
MAIFDYVTILVFTIGILFTGAAFSKTGKTMKSFFAADGAIPWWISGLSLYMGFHSAGTFVVWGSIAYTHGWVAITIQLTMCVAGLLVGFFIAPRWRKTGALTAAEYIINRLGKNTQKTYTYLFLLISMFSSGAFLYPVAKIVQVSTGLDLSMCIILLGLFSILYVSVGGLWAVIVTDMLQFVILTAAIIIVVPLAFDKVGGVHSFIQKAPEGFFNVFNGDYTLEFIIPFCIYNLFFLGGSWSYVQRYTSVKSPKDAKKVGWMFGILYLVSPFLWMLPPMIYRIYNPTLNGMQDEGAYLLMCKEALPVGLLGLMLGGLIFATASALNGLLNISAGVITNDIYKRLKPQSTDAKQMKVARLSTIVFGGIAILIALSITRMGGIVNVVISIAALTGVPLYLPVIWSLFSRKQTGRSVLSVTIISLLVNGIFKFILPLIFTDFQLNRAHEMILGVSVPFVLLVITEIELRLNPAPNKDYDNYLIIQEEKARKALEPIIEDVKSNVAPKRNANAYGIKVMGIGVTSIGLMIDILGAQASNGNALIISVGTFVMALGAFILYGSYKMKKRSKD